MNARHPDAARRARLRQAFVVAVLFGLAAAALTFVSGRWALNYFGPTPTDGNFVLDTPGVYDQPPDDGLTNADATGQAVPSIELIDADGRSVRLSVERPTIINLWFSTCAACERELPDFAQIDAEFGERVDIVGVDPFDTVDEMIRFAEARGVNYRLLRDPDRAFINALGVTAFPVTLIVDADGVIQRQFAEVDADLLRTNIAELFPSTSSSPVSPADDSESTHDEQTHDEQTHDERADD